MRKILLLGTIFVATNVWAFGGIGIGPWQKHKNQGVDAIGVHIDSTGKKANIDITDGDSDESSCPSERKCGDYCCGEANECVGGNKCCLSIREQWGDHENNMCCDATESSGWYVTHKNEPGTCCPIGSAPYISLMYGGGDYEWVGCCDGVVFKSWEDEEGYYEQTCCPAGSTGYDMEHHQCITP